MRITKTMAPSERGVIERYREYLPVTEATPELADIDRRGEMVICSCNI